MIVLYDWHGGYGHPDHIQVHRVGHRAADLAGTPRRFEATYNRDRIAAMMQDGPRAGVRSERSSRRWQPVRHRRGRSAPRRRRQRLHRAAAGRIVRPRQPGHRHRDVPRLFRRAVPRDVLDGVVHRARRATGHARGLAARRVERLMALLYLVRHGRATGGWDVDTDPGLDALGRRQADGLVERLGPLGPLPVVSSPLRRCQETAAPLAVHWQVDAGPMSGCGQVEQTTRRGTRRPNSSMRPAGAYRRRWRRRGAPDEVRANARAVHPGGGDVEE